MVKKSTRRSWALTAAFALFASIFASAPAQAAGEVTLAPSAGSSYNVLITDTFKLDAALGVGVNNAFAAQLKYKVANADARALSYTVSGTATGTESGVTSTSFVISAKASSTVASSLEISMDNTGTSSASVDVVVTAFVDADNDNALDAGEWQQARTISFLKYSAATGTVAVTAPAEGASTIKATGGFTNINEDQLDGSVTIQFVKNGATYGAAKVVDSDGVATTSSAVAAADTYSAKLIYNGETIATAATAASTDRTIDSVSASVVTSTTGKQTGDGTADAKVNSAFTVQILTSTSSSDLVGVAASGTFKITTTETLGTGVTLTVDGTTHTTTSTLPTSSAFTTDANGKATIALTTVGFSTSKNITVEVTAQNYTETLVISQSAAVYTVTNTDGDYAYTTKGGSTTLNYKVADQWKGVPSGVTQRIKVVFSGASNTMTTAYGDVSAGVASVNVVASPSTLAGTVTAAGHLEERDSNGYWAVDSSATTDSAVSVKFSADGLAFSTDPASDSASVSGATATVSGALNHEGGSVTLTGAGLTFTNASGTTASDTMTVRTAANGLFTVSAHSKVAGKYPVTVTAGTYSKAIVITIDAITAHEATKMSITQLGGGSYVAPGSTLRVVFKLTDDNGNIAANSAASLSVTVTGPGFTGTLPTKTDKNGEATLNVLLGSQDTGTVKVEGSFAAAKTVTSSAEFTVGTAPAAEVEKKITVGSFKGFIAIYTKGYEGSKLSAKVAGKWLVVPSLSNWNGKDYSRTVRFTGAGYLIQVHLYIDGEFVRTDEVTTK